MARKALPAPSTWGTPRMVDPAFKARVELVVPFWPERIAAEATVTAEVRLPVTFKVPTLTKVAPV